MGTENSKILDKTNKGNAVANAIIHPKLMLRIAKRFKDNKLVIELARNFNDFNDVIKIIKVAPKFTKEIVTVSGVDELKVIELLPDKAVEVIGDNIILAELFVSKFPELAKKNKNKSLLIEFVFVSRDDPTNTKDIIRIVKEVCEQAKSSLIYADNRQRDLVAWKSITNLILKRCDLVVSFLDEFVQYGDCILKLYLGSKPTIVRIIKKYPGEIKGIIKMYRDIMSFDIMPTLIQETPKELLSQAEYLNPREVKIIRETLLGKKKHIIQILGKKLPQKPMNLIAISGTQSKSA